MKTIRLSVILIFFLSLFLNCTSQSGETYWIAKGVKKVDGKPMHGVTLGYMEYIIDQRIHLSTQGDSILFHYPTEEKILSKDLKSLTYLTVEGSTALLDSVYDIGVDDGALTIKFNYIGTLADDKRFLLYFREVSKDEYFADIKDIKEQITTVKEKLKPIVFNQFDLSIPQPQYFNEKDLETLEYISDAVRISHPSVSYRNDEVNFSCEGIAVTMESENSYPMLFDSIPFHSVEYIWKGEDKKMEAIILKDYSLTKKQVANVLESLTKQNSDAQLTYGGLPTYSSEKKKDFLRIDDRIHLSWRDEDKIIKLELDGVSQKLYDKGVDKKVILPYRSTPEECFNVFKHYLNLLNEPTVKVFIVSKELDMVLTSSDYSGGRSGSLVGY